MLIPGTNDTGSSMGEPNQQESDPEKERPDGLDEKRFARNVLASWGGYFIVVVSGFILPRLISDHVGQERLGVWDLGWSFVAYLSLLTFGISSSVNRYVAKYSTEGRSDLLNSTVSACLLIFSCTGLAAALIGLAMSASLPYVFGARLGHHMAEARSTLLVLCVSAAIGMPLSVFGGVITGRLRYGLASLIMGGCQILMLVSMIVVLLLGGGLLALSLVVLAVELLRGVLRAAAAYRLCDNLRISSRLVTRSVLRNVTTFGGKSFLLGMSRAFLYQTNNMIIIYFLGPAALAVYARAVSLVLRGGRFVQQYGRVVTPTASAAQTRQDPAALGMLLIRTTRHSLLMTLPLVLMLVILGDPLLRLWMGEGYACGAVLAILAIGHLLSLTQYGTVCFLGGLNKHGWPAVTILGTAICSAATSAVLAGPLKMGLVGVACSVAVCLTIANGVIIPIVAARTVGLPLAKYLRQSACRPVVVGMAFALALLLGRKAGGNSDAASLACGLGFGAMVMIVSCRRLLLPAALERRIVRIFRPARETESS